MKIYIGNLAFETTDEELTMLLSAAGDAHNVKIVRDQRTGMARGYGFAEFDSEEDAITAIEFLSGRRFGGRELVLKPSVNNESHS